MQTCYILISKLDTSDQYYFFWQSSSTSYYGVASCNVVLPESTYNGDLKNYWLRLLDVIANFGGKIFAK